MIEDHISPQTDTESVETTFQEVVIPSDEMPLYTYTAKALISAGLGNYSCDRSSDQKFRDGSFLFKSGLIRVQVSERGGDDLSVYNDVVHAAVKQQRRLKEMHYPVNDTYSQLYLGITIAVDALKSQLTRQGKFSPPSQGAT